MPTYWITPQADLDAPFPNPEGDALSESFYGLIGAGCSALFDHFPPVFTQLQRLAGVDIDTVLPLSVSARFTDPAELDRSVARVAKDVALVRPRFIALRQGLLRRPGWQRELVLPQGVYGPTPAYFERFETRPLRADLEPWELELGEERYDPDEPPSLRADLDLVLRFLDHAHRRGAPRVWFLSR